ncbi:DUF4912 domain-containing protein [Clostridium felsineum]|uniref:Uncharacterized protein n=1 Tax=Clostridium felsineum TaxID=36839 RepID=A0A1S8LBT4_9CLOT|nr:DUF4912 domain-containing protein [Clostridium felsineum]MCR3761236.1 DUF4912 domain-containing protein [Clostridium felsineum]URZ00049.1 hypothetical protein CLAUR_000320 [Clostridium felsineum]URZ07306.1 hypothetical protein CLROS_026440 [Clostridium felsineum]URZ12337.1 hypothetical protein CROST_030590 [Clostridium felsineum]URZ16999.1 hypothetical protein CLFE_030510 [Clostridium felsineum DSM 794]
MLGNYETKLVLLVQNAYNVFCYFNVSPITIKEFEYRYGENLWENSKPVLKIYEIINGNAQEIKTLYIDSMADNWYIKLDRDDMDIFVKLGRKLPDDTFVAVVASNTVTTPRNHISGDSAVYYMDVSQNFEKEEETIALTTEEKVNKEYIHKGIKPYTFMEGKKN